MNKLIMMIGIPGSGKSKFAQELAKTENTIILSSDKLRKELYGTVNEFNKNGELFQELYKRAKVYLENDNNIILDATNINRKKRIGVIKQFKKYKKECWYICTSYKICKIFNNTRDRKVDESVIEKMYKTLHVPSYIEGWDKININVLDKNGYVSLGTNKEMFENAFQQENITYKKLFNCLNGIPEFNKIHELPQDTPYHTLSVGRHTYYVFKYIQENYHEQDKLVMLWAALLHDIGKTFCKNFKEGSKYANFIGHENVSAQLACNILYKLEYDIDFILKVTDLVQLHMRLLQIQTEKSLDKFIDYLSNEDIFNKLMILREADMNAK